MITRSENIAGIVVGRKHTGKSTGLAETATSYAGNKVLIIDVNRSPAYNKFAEITIDQLKRLKSGKVKLVGTPDEDTLKTIAKEFRGGLIIFEDCTKYISGNVRPEIRTFLVDHRMWQCDLIFTFHSLKMIPPFFWQMISYVKILKTQENFINAANRNRVPNFEKIVEAYKEVEASPDNYYSVTVETLV
ncbi:MAG: hypothetical protein ACXVJE_19375 [Mucilaginibacter sp.]